MHMIMWVLSDRALPRSYRIMEGFGVYTSRLVNFSQATLFWNSQSAVKKQHIVDGFHFELGKVDSDLAVEVAMGIGIPTPVTGAQPHHSQTSQALSMAPTVENTMKSRRIAILAASGVD
jgi:catalase